MADAAITIGNSIILGNGVSGVVTYIGWDTRGWDTFGWDGEYGVASGATNVTPGQYNNVTSEYLQDGSPDYYVFPTPVTNVVCMVTATYTSVAAGAGGWSTQAATATTWASGAAGTTTWAAASSVTTTWS